VLWSSVLVSWHEPVCVVPVWIAVATGDGPWGLRRVWLKCSGANVLVVGRTCLIYDQTTWYEEH
jgi:hypothetical protein